MKIILPSFRSNINLSRSLMAVRLLLLMRYDQIDRTCRPGLTFRLRLRVHLSVSPFFRLEPPFSYIVHNAHPTLYVTGGRLSLVPFTGRRTPVSLPLQTAPARVFSLALTVTEERDWWPFAIIVSTDLTSPSTRPVRVSSGLLPKTDIMSWLGIGCLLYTGRTARPSVFGVRRCVTSCRFE